MRKDVKKVLIVDDDAGIVSLLVRLVQKRGHQPITASDGVTALELAYSQQPDLIFTDLLMPDLNGNELVHLLKTDSLLMHIPLVILSGTATMIDMDEIMADDVLTKPFQLQTVYNVLDRYLKSTPTENLEIPSLSTPPFRQLDSNFIAK